MSNLYFKDANGEYHPVTVDHLDIRPNSVIFLQFKATNDRHFSHSELEGLLSVVEEVIGDDRQEKGIEIIVMASEIKIEILDRDKDLDNKEIKNEIIQEGGTRNEPSKSYS